MTPTAPTAHRVLVVDDAPESRMLLRRALTRDGFAVDEAEDGEAAIESVAARPPDLVLLDIAMPGMSGIDVLRELRRERAVPVILVTGRAEEVDRVVGLELGADDYVVKPFSLLELAARVRAVLRRTTAAVPPARLRYGALEIRLAAHEVLLHGDLVELTAKEFELLAFLASSPRRVFSREELLQAVWGSTSQWQDPATVTEHVRRLRRKVEADPERPRWLATVRGVGYRFDP